MRQTLAETKGLRDKVPGTSGTMTRITSIALAVSGLRVASSRSSFKDAMLQLEINDHRPPTAQHSQPKKSLRGSGVSEQMSSRRLQFNKRKDDHRFNTCLVFHVSSAWPQGNDFQWFIFTENLTGNDS